MQSTPWLLTRFIVLSYLPLLLNAFAAAPADSKTEPGLRVQFVAGADAKAALNDVIVRPEFALYVPENKSVTPFMPTGQFTSNWKGYVSSELRGEYTFQIDLNGSCELSINGTNILSAGAKGSQTISSQSVRLSKGNNSVVATFTSPPKGEAYFRVQWIPKGGFAIPVPNAALAHATEEKDATGNASANLSLKESMLRYQGRELFLEYRCARCHDAGGKENPSSELQMDAPSFAGIGSRRRYEWLAEWILNPKAHRIVARMPQIFTDTDASERATAAAAYLATLTETTPQPSVSEPSDEEKEAGQKLFNDLHCTACHSPPDQEPKESRLISLREVARKFADGSLPAFLRAPATHYAWIRMPDFKFTAAEADYLTAYLLGAAVKASEPKIKSSPALIARGQQLIQDSGCLNCHTMDLPNRFATKPLVQLKADRWQSGCLSDRPSPTNAAPAFAFSESERAALRVFGETDRSSLQRACSADFATRHIQNLSCRECHGKVEGFPPLDILGSKLRTPWMKSFVGGEIGYRPRQWLAARMPAFPKYANALASGMAQLNGLPSDDAPEPPIDTEMAKSGQTLVSAQGGLSCIACHAIGKVPATQVFENAGVNMAHINSRLRKSYYWRWIRNPLAIDPVSKMPMFFDEELRSPLVDIYGGDGARQIEAIWQYLRYGEKVPAPPSAP